MHHLRHLPGLIGLAAALSACSASEGRYPSLALRPFEVSPPEAAAPAPPPIRSGIDPAMIDTLTRRAEAAHAAFLAAQGTAAPLAEAARGLAIESPARARALVALGEVSSRRSDTAAVLAEIDALAADAATRLARDPALEAAQAEVAALLTREDAVLAQLWEAMGS
ncbi:MAG: hypothetical protein KatS3mg120_0409 [Erythrobacter sp.]|nr:MAG: hypothetical protein KatS3mg120_0409 [Erythrobacter sp.]